MRARKGSEQPKVGATSGDQCRGDYTITSKRFGKMISYLKEVLYQTTFIAAFKKMIT